MILSSTSTSTGLRPEYEYDQSQNDGNHAGRRVDRPLVKTPQAVLACISLFCRAEHLRNQSSATVNNSQYNDLIVRDPIDHPKRIDEKFTNVIPSKFGHNGFRPRMSGELRRSFENRVRKLIPHMQEIDPRCNRRFPRHRQTPSRSIGCPLVVILSGTFMCGKATPHFVCINESPRFLIS